MKQSYETKPSGRTGGLAMLAALAVLGIALSAGVANAASDQSGLTPEQ